MKQFLTTIFSLLSLTVLAQTSNVSFDWNNPKYAFAKAYLYGLQEEEAGDIIIDGHLNPTVVDTIGVTLTEKQIRKVISVVTGNNKGELNQVKECFQPHHGIVFYSKDNVPVASLSICFYCERMKVEPVAIEPDKGLDILKKVILDLEFPVFRGPTEYMELGESIKLKSNK